MANIIVNGMAWMFTFYVIAGFSVYLFQRKLIYAPDPTRVSPEQAGLPQAREVLLDTPDGVRLVAWHIPARDGKPTLLYFHGKKGNLARRRDRIRQITRDGYGLFMLAYRGYAGSTGRPSEHKIIADGKLAHDYLRGQGLTARQIVVFGESLGTGVATQVAAGRQSAALVLEAPFTSLIAVGRLLYPMFPAHRFMDDKYRSARHIGQINAPLLIVHGTADKLIPIELGIRLYHAAQAPKEMVRVPGVGHTGLFRAGIWSRINQFLTERVMVEETVVDAAQADEQVKQTEPRAVMADNRSERRGRGQGRNVRSVRTTVKLTRKEKRRRNKRRNMPAPVIAAEAITRRTARPGTVPPA